MVALFLQNRQLTGHMGDQVSAWRKSQMDYHKVLFCHRYVQLLALYTDLECHNIQRYRWMDRQNHNANSQSDRLKTHNITSI